MLLQYRDIEGDRVDDSFVTFVPLLSHQLLLIRINICLNDSEKNSLYLIIHLAHFVSKYFCDTIHNYNKNIYC